MHIYHGIDDFQKPAYAVVTSGTFDGVHLGHQKILSRVKELAKEKGGETVLLTFWPHPRMVLQPEDTSLQLLNTFEEKSQLLREQGIDHLIRIPFTKEFSQLSSEEFVQKILVEKIGTKKLVIGYDHRFGKNREGSFEYLSAHANTYGFEVEEISRQDVEDIGVSSTQIRKALQEGNVHHATELLGKPYFLTGRVVKGDRLGRLLGFPTANLDIEYNYKLIPADGAYAVRVKHEEQWLKGMLNVGVRPTVGGKRRTIEAHIFDFDRDIYGETLQISFIRPIRPEIKFPDLEALKAQLLKDKEEALRLLNLD
jgi:riboflavin kinase / FMN adenylyltransferase